MCLRFLLFIIAGVILARFIYGFIIRSSYRSQADQIIRQGEGSIRSIDYLIHVLSHQAPPSSGDKQRIQKLKKIRSDLKRGVKHVDSRVVEDPGEK